MNPEQIIAELEDLAKKSGITIRFDKGDFDGGYCVLKKEKLILVNKRLVPQKKAAVMALAVAEIGIDEFYLKPALREFIEDEIARRRT